MIIDHRDNDKFLEQARLNKIPQGLGINNLLDNNLRFKKGSFNIILGHANVGKTYWVLWYFLALSKIHNKRHLIYSLTLLLRILRTRFTSSKQSTPA